MRSRGLVSHQGTASRRCRSDDSSSQSEHKLDRGLATSGVASPLLLARRHPTRRAGRRARPHHVSDLRVAGGPDGIPSRRRRAPQLRIRRGQRRVPAGPADRSGLRHGLLGRSDDVPPDLWRNEDVAAGRRVLPRLAPTPAARAAKAATEANAVFSPPSRSSSVQATAGTPRRRTRRRWRSCTQRARRSRTSRIVLRAGTARDHGARSDGRRRRARGPQCGAGRQRRPNARVRRFSTGSCGRTRNTPARCTTCCTTTTTPRTRGSRCRRRAPTPRSRRNRATRGTCRLTFFCSSGCGTRPRTRIAPPLPRRRRG